VKKMADWYMILANLRKLFLKPCAPQARGAFSFSERAMESTADVRQTALYAWTSVFYAEAVDCGFIEPPWGPDLEWDLVLRMLSYFNADADPGDAVHAIFGLRN
jgi:hypothetical protein